MGVLTNEPRAATLIAKTDTVCLALSREDFVTMLGPLNDIMERNMEEYEKPADKRKPIGHKQTDSCCNLDQFKTIGILGRGAFTRIIVGKVFCQTYWQYVFLYHHIM